jgi:hypothetical protein
MAILTEEMKNVLKILGKGGAVVHLTTSSVEGKPNIVGERFVTSYKDEYILIADMFAQKTKVNLNENPVAAISIAFPNENHKWVFRGPATILTNGLPKDTEWEGLHVADVLEEWSDRQLRCRRISDRQRLRKEE